MINSFLHSEKLKVEDQEYVIIPVLTCDLKALMKILGLYNIYHPSSQWRCPYCPVCSRYNTKAFKCASKLTPNNGCE